MPPNTWGISEIRISRLADVVKRMAKRSFTSKIMVSASRPNIVSASSACSTNWMRAVKARALVSPSRGESSSFMEVGSGLRAKRERDLHFASRSRDHLPRLEIPHKSMENYLNSFLQEFEI